jgi:hypothetical protein
MAGNATTFMQPRMDDTEQRLLYKIALLLSAASGSGSPVGVVVPAYSNQLYYDTVGNVWYRAGGDFGWTRI